MPDGTTPMTDDAKVPFSHGVRNIKTEQPRPDRRELVKRLGKAAILPAVVATFLASDVTDAAAS